jgi:hypothetical protein
MQIPCRVQIYNILELPLAGDWSMAAKDGPMSLISSHYNVTGKMEDLLLSIQGKLGAFIATYYPISRVHIKLSLQYDNECRHSIVQLLFPYKSTCKRERITQIDNKLTLNFYCNHRYPPLNL